ncbi:MAG: hypothetical protein C0594_01120, partial [Marinilabiliales bacterium]
MVIQVSAQEEPNFSSYDKLTYRLYVEKKYDSLILIGNEALQNGFDYYYLRMRLGIAFYENAKYLSALKQFKKAEEYNSGDKLILEYQYYCLVFSGQPQRARMLASRFPEELKKKLFTAGGVLYSAGIESGIGRNLAYNDQLNQIPEDYNIYDERAIPAQYTLAGLSLQHKTFNRLNFHHRYSYLLIDKFQQIYDDEKGRQNFQHKTEQNAYYIRAQLLLNDGWELGAAFHSLWTTRYITDVDYNLTIGKEIPVYSNNKEQLAEQIYHASIARRTKHVKWTLGAGFGTINSLKKRQYNLGIVVYPFQNTNFYTISDIAYNETILPNNTLSLSGPGPGGGGKLSSLNSSGSGKWIFSQTLGAKVWKVWLEANASIGKMQNYMEDNAAFIYNDIDPMYRKYGFSLIVPYKRLNFSLT